MFKKPHVHCCFKDLTHLKVCVLVCLLPYLPKSLWKASPTLCFHELFRCSTWPQSQTVTITDENWTCWGRSCCCEATCLGPTQKLQVAPASRDPDWSLATRIKIKTWRYLIIIINIRIIITFSNHLLLKLDASANIALCSDPQIQPMYRMKREKKEKTLSKPTSGFCLKWSREKVQLDFIPRQNDSAGIYLPRLQSAPVMETR